ncbi:putative bifunctional diguanylate cyclase/phosphodiesterase [Erythrobacter litoralis]|uniref:putative bifunctional diguanylate cyclase/phosphodiesterase n=1 Tax=Erythrobacter litoralis TaxID=39960 RepID=UPI00243610D8|nr:EAL domain-containing protein [Erythrobacter litoralis]
MDLQRSEECRLAALKSYDLFDSGSGEIFDALTAYAADAFGADFSFVSLIGEHDVWLQGSTFPERVRIDRETSLCARTLLSNEPVVVPDVSTQRPDQTAIGFYAGAPLIDAEGFHLGALCVCDSRPRAKFDDADRQRLTELAKMAVSLMEHHKANKLHRAIGSFASVMNVALLTSNSDGIITFWNDAAEQMFGHSAADAVGKPIEIIIPERFRAQHSEGMKRTVSTGFSKLAGKTVELAAVRADGSEFPIELRLASWNGPSGLEFGGQIYDISARKERERHLEHLAHHDPLTGLINRSGFIEQLDRSMKDGTTAVFAIDLDGFKEVNDTFGHAVGDSLLQSVALRLVGLLERTGTVARVGGDEFAVFLTNFADIGDASKTAQCLCEAFEEPFLMSGHKIFVGLSIGMAFAPLHAEDAEELLLKADVAQLAAKKRGGRMLQVFDRALSNKLQARRAFKDEMRRATEEGQWKLLYQPQNRLSDGSLIGVEALLRWEHPERGLLKPADFLETLETHLVASEVGSWVIDEACRQLNSWRMQGFDVPRIGINLFGVQFKKASLAETIGNAIEEYALQPHDLELEITETIALRSDDMILGALNDLRNSGVHIAFDDFGTGFASLSTLAKLPVSRLKIDRSFVSDLGLRPHGAAIISAVVTLARQLGLEVIAEGVETDDQRLRLMGLGCMDGQGYLFGKPVSGSVLFDRHRIAA